MKVLICLSLFIAVAWAGFVSYPIVPIVRPPVYSSFYPAFSAHQVIKPIYSGFYDYRLGLTPSLYPLGYYPTGGVFGGPTIIHLIPAEPDADKKKKPKGDKGKGDKDGDKEETTTPSGEEGKDDDPEKPEEKGDD